MCCRPGCLLIWCWAAFVCNRWCLISSALILHGGHPGCSKQQPHTADSAGLSPACHPRAAATWKAHLLATILCRCHPPFKSEGKEGRWKGEEGKREAHPERMRDKDGSRDILSTFISSGGGEPRWILACYWQSHTLWSADGAHVTIKSTPPHFHLPHCKKWDIWGRMPIAYFIW